MMKFFLDTAKVSDIREINSLGVIAVTTNFTNCKGKRDLVETLKEIAAIVDGPISGGSLDYENMIKEAEDLAAIHPNIVVKILHHDGLKVSYLSKRNKTNVTLIFSAAQALLAARAGATMFRHF